MVEEPDKSESPIESYTAILYFHGMGIPRRHEEISRLTDALDHFSELQDPASVGRLREQNVFIDPARAAQEEDVAYVGFTRTIRRFRDQIKKEGYYRVYEGYWSPSTAGGYSAIRVLWWLVSRVASPIRVLSRAWRKHQRLKLATIYRMHFTNSDPLTEHYLQQIESHYRSFENWDARRQFKRGSYSEFCAYLRDKHSQNPPKLEPMLKLARDWKNRFRNEQLLLLLLCITFFLAALEVTAGVSFLGLNWLAKIASWIGVPGFVPSLLSEYVTRNSWWLIADSLLLMVLVMRGRSHLSNFWADVMFWSVQREKDTRFAKRRDILRSGDQILRQVLSDPQCKRIVVIGHSLGSAIAYECLMRLGRRLRARPSEALGTGELSRLNRISHFVTFGSPIDHIHYFFELHVSRIHRYNRIQERFRGDTSDPPFSDLAGNQGTTWINISDDADPISSMLFSPRRRIPNRDAILEVQVSSAHHANFLAAHTDYLSCFTAMRVIFWVAILGRLPPVSQKPKIELRPWARYLIRGLAWLMVLTLPWTAAGALLTYFGGFTFLSQVLSIVGCVQFCVLVLIRLTGHFLAKVHPLLVDDIALSGT